MKNLVLIPFAAFLLITVTSEFLRADTPATAPAAPVRPPVPAPAPVATDVIRLFMMDGSIITGKLSINQIAIDTKYGSLKVPITEIRSVTPGLDSHPQLSKQVDELIAKLGAENFQEREKAQASLSKLGAMIKKELERHLTDPEMEIHSRVQAILDELNESNDEDASPESKMTYNRLDSIETNDFTIVGKITSITFQVDSLYGPLNVNLRDIRKAQKDAPAQEEVRKNLAVSGANMTGKDFLESGLRVNRGDIVTITAEGSITMSPWGGNAASTPEGTPNYGWFMPNTIAIGALVGKTGNGQVFKIGSKSTFTVQHAGELSFAIAMNPEYVNNNFPGEYKLKVRIQRK